VGIDLHRAATTVIVRDSDIEAPGELAEQPASTTAREVGSVWCPPVRRAIFYLDRMLHLRPPAWSAGTTSSFRSLLVARGESEPMWQRGMSDRMSSETRKPGLDSHEQQGMISPPGPAVRSGAARSASIVGEGERTHQAAFFHRPPPLFFFFFFSAPPGSVLGGHGEYFVEEAACSGCD